MHYDWNNGQNSGCHGLTVFGKAVSSIVDNVSEEHGLTEDGKTVAPMIVAFCSKKRIDSKNANIPYSVRFIWPASPSL